MVYSSFIARKYIKQFAVLRPARSVDARTAALQLQKLLRLPEWKVSPLNFPRSLPRAAVPTTSCPSILTKCLVQAASCRTCPVVTDISFSITSSRFTQGCPETLAGTRGSLGLAPSPGGSNKAEGSKARGRGRGQGGAVSSLSTQSSRCTCCGVCQGPFLFKAE